MLPTDAATSDRVVAGRQFRLESGIWIDRAHKTGTSVMQIEPFSRAYFDLLGSLPELKAYATALEAVTVAGSRVSIRIAPGGRTTLTAAERTRMVADFRGAGETP